LAAPRQIGVAPARSRTDSLPLLGAEGIDAARAELARRGLDPGETERLVACYGALAAEVGRELLRDPALAAPLPGAAPHLAAEVAYAVSHEGALHVADVLARRMRVSIEAVDGGRVAAPSVAETMAPLLGWSDARVRDEVDRYCRWLDAERALA
jgi:glycerol-3-phosphate dehydrogenase